MIGGALILDVIITIGGTLILGYDYNDWRGPYFRM